MKEIDNKILKKFIEIAANKLTGDWVILGGNVLQVIGLTNRTTTDIDLAGPLESKKSEMIKLFEIAEELELPIESINEAAAYFLHKIPSWQKSIKLVHTGKKASFYRPDINLFIQLKAKRMLDSDLNDCLLFIEKNKTKPLDVLDTKKLEKILSQEIKKTDSKEKKERLMKLMQTLEG